MDAAGAERDIDWISVDSLAPMGSAATHSVSAPAARQGWPNRSATASSVS
jgi:hypothetical protein